MPPNTAYSPKGPTKYTGPGINPSSVVTRNRQPTGADYRQPENGKLYPVSSFWLVGDNPTTGVVGELWYLSKIVANVAYWVKLSNGSVGPLLMVTVPSGVSPIIPDGTGTMNFTSSLGTLTITGSSASPNNHTINFDLSGGSVGIDSVAVQSVTAPGVSPVLPTVAGLLTVNGAAVAAHSVPVETRSRALNTYALEVQYASSNATTDANKSGLSHYNSAHFTVDANGFVSLIGGGLAIDSIGVDATSGTGTNPVLPTVAGLITVNGALVAAGTNPLRTVSTAPNVYQIQLQTSQALAAPDSTKVGASNFNNLDFAVDANGFVQLTGSGSAVGVKNIGITYASGSGTFTVLGQDGISLSATNMGFVTLQDRSSPGLLKTIAVTANQTFLDDNGASQIIGNLFGLTTGIATTGVDVPFFVYAVCNDAEDTIAFMISRFPNATASPVSTKIGKPGSAIADTQGSFYCLPNITVTDYDLNPCIVIGSFRMRMSAADDWTVQALAERDGIGHYQQGLQFAFPRGQFGSATGKVFKDNGGTAPDDSAGGFTYYMDSENNRFYYQLAFPSITTAGVGAVNAQLAMPFNRVEGATMGGGFVLGAGAVYSVVATYVLPTTNTAESAFTNPIASGLLLNNSFSLTNSIALNGSAAIDYS